MFGLLFASESLLLLLRPQIYSYSVRVFLKAPRHSPEFFQNYILPTRYGYDKRKAHLSSLIISKQISREEALNELSKSLYQKQELENDINFFLDKMNISKEEFNAIMSLPKKSYKDYKNWDLKVKILNILNYLSKITVKRVFRKIKKILNF